MNLLTLAQQQHVYGFEGRTSQMIFIAGFAAMVVVALLVTKMSFKHWVLAGILFVTCLAPSVDSVLIQYNPTWMFTAQFHHAEIHLGLSVFLTIMVIATTGFRVRLMSAQGVFMFLMGLYAGLMQFFHDDALTALQAQAFALATIPCFVLAVGSSADSFDGCLKLLRMLMWVSVLWAFCCSVQFVINPRYLLSYQGRFLGMLGNPQHAAALVAPMAVVATWLTMNDPQRRTRILWIALIAINLLFLGWTGSRTGGMMFVVGLTAILYARAGKAILMLPVAAMLLWLLSFLAGELEIGANLERFINTQNTRQNVISGQIAAIMENPLIGIGWRGEGLGTENSYLGGFAAYGIVYFILTICLLIASVWQCMRLNLQRKWIAPEHRPLIDLFTAFNAMFFAGAVFEGYLLARSFVPQLMLLLFAAIGLWIRNEIAANQADALHIPYADEEQSEYDRDELVDGTLAHE